MNSDLRIFDAPKGFGLGVAQPPDIAEPVKGKAWRSQSAEEVLAQLGSAPTGLSAQEAAQCLPLVAVFVRRIVMMVLRRQPRVAKDPNNQPNDRLEPLAPKGATA